MSETPTTCPECGSSHVDRDEVDTGVGTQCGPLACFDCGWVEWDVASLDFAIDGERRSFEAKNNTNSLQKDSPLMERKDGSR